MTPHQAYIDALLDAVANEPFPSDEQRETLLAVKGHLASAPDLTEALKQLYKVEHFDEFALSLLWVQQQVQLDPARMEPTADDQYLVSMKFRQAFSEGQPEASPSFPVPAMEVPMPEPAPEPPAAPEPLAVAYSSSAPEDTFPQLLDKFVIATQAGVDDRSRLLEKVVHSAGEISHPDSDYSSDLQEFCSKLVAFLSYVKGNQYLDDVRTMNILSAVSDAMTLWSSTSVEARAGLLSDGIKALAEAKSHFE